MRTNRQRLDVDHKMNRLHHVRSHRGKVLRLAQKHCSDSCFNPEKTLKLSVKNCDLTLTHPKKTLKYKCGNRHLNISMLFAIWDDLLTCYYWELMTSKEKIKVLWQCVGSPWAATDDPSTCRECLLSGGGSVKNM